MSDQNTVPEAYPASALPVPEIPPVNPPDPPANEPSSTAGNPVKISIAAKVRSAAAGVISKAGFTFKKGRGRPKNCAECGGVGCESCGYTGKMPGKLDQAETPEPAENPAPISAAGLGLPSMGVSPAPDSSVSALFRRSCVASVKGVLGICKAVVSTYASAAGVDSKFTAQALAKAEPEAEAMADFTESLDAVLKKRNIQPENAEEWALAINGARLLAPFALLLAEFKGEIRRQRMEKEAK